MSPKISTPVEGFTGTVAGVNFANGLGETEDPSALAYFERQGYKIHPASTADTSKESGTKGLTPKQKAQAAAAELGLSTEGTQAEIEKRIAEHKQITEPKGDDGDSGTGNDADKGNDGDGTDQNKTGATDDSGGKE